MEIYFDNAATTPVSQTARDAMMVALTEEYGNPSSLHHKGRTANERLEEARASIAKDLNADPGEIYFTSGGSEADNWAITQAAELGARRGKKHIISTVFEHHAVLHTLKKLQKQGFEVTLLPVHEDGLVRVEEVKAALREDTALVTIMYANNEVGTIQPIPEIGALCRARRIPFHTDAVQAVGHIPVDVKADQIDYLSLSGHKFHGPKGVGVLYCRRGMYLTNLIEGGAQERGKRGGTEALPNIMGMAAALHESVEHMDENIKKVTALRNKLIEGLRPIPASYVNGDLNHRVPGNVSMCFEGVEGESLLLRLDLAGICGSSGSACTSGSLEPSHVLLSIGLPVEVAHGSLRLSLSEWNTEAEVDEVLKQLPEIVYSLRQMSPVWEDMLAEGKVRNVVMEEN